MTRKEFEKSKEPLVFISSVNPETGKTKFYYYPYETMEFWLEVMEKDFPDYITLFTVNKAVTDARIKRIMGDLDKEIK